MRRFLLAAALILGVTTPGQAQPGAASGDAVTALRLAQSGAPVIVAPRRIDINQETVDFAGTVEAAGEVTLTVNGLPLAVAGDGSFRVRRTVLVGRSRLVLVARDSRGNRVEKKIYVRRTTKSADEIDFGRYHALVIGNNDYRELTKLKTAVADAEAVAALLDERYGYEVTSLTNATRYEIVSALGRMRAKLTENDNLLIYYAGHGQLDVESDEGYWLPVDAERDNAANWLSNATITAQLRAMRAKHVLVVADSCYSGTLTREAGAELKTGAERNAWLKRMAQRRSRTALASGGLEPVVDAGGRGHSVFARAFLEVLGSSTEILDGQSLFDAIKQPVVVNADQTPVYADVRKAGHDGGDFLFVPIDAGPPDKDQPQVAAAGTDAAARPALDPAEQALWAAISETTNPGDYMAYLGAYPAGLYAPLAKARIVALKSEADNSAEEAKRKAAAEAQRRAAAETQRLKSEAELAFWGEIKNSDDPADYQAYLEAYPAGRFTALARVRAETKAAERRLAEDRLRAETKAAAGRLASPPSTTVAALTPQQPASSLDRLAAYDGQWTGRAFLKDGGGYCPISVKLDVDIVGGKVAGRTKGSYGYLGDGSISPSGELKVEGGAAYAIDLSGSLSAETGKGSGRWKVVLYSDDCAGTFELSKVE